MDNKQSTLWALSFGKAASYINLLVADAHETSISKGWHESGMTMDKFVHAIKNRRGPTMRRHADYIAGKLLMLVDEVLEVTDHIRKPVGPTQQATSPTYEATFKNLLTMELADVVIRTFDLAGWMGVDLGSAIIMKMRDNKGRAFRHGGKLL